MHVRLAHASIHEGKWEAIMRRRFLYLNQLQFEPVNGSRKDRAAVRQVMRRVEAMCMWMMAVLNVNDGIRDL